MIHSRLIFLSFFFKTVLHALIVQLKNSLRPDLCVDQGPDSDNIPILYLCHGMTPQVSAPSPTPHDLPLIGVELYTFFFFLKFHFMLVRSIV